MVRGPYVNTNTGVVPYFTQQEIIKIRLRNVISLFVTVELINIKYSLRAYVTTSFDVFKNFLIKHL